MIGAIYIDGGLNAAEEFIMDKLDDIIKTAVDGSLRYDYKTLLQEYAQSHEMGDLTYELKRVDGPEPVSYTHLDVYKRQHVFRAVVCLVKNRIAQCIFVSA